MAKVEKRQVQKRMEEGLGIQTAVGQAPEALDNKITPTFEVNNKYSEVVASALKSSTGSTTIYTIEDKRDFYLTSVQISGMTNGAYDGSDGVVVRITDLNNESTDIAVLAIIESQAKTTSISFPYPIRLLKGNTIRGINSFTAGTLKSEFIITGFYD